MHRPRRSEVRLDTDRRRRLRGERAHRARRPGFPATTIRPTRPPTDFRVTVPRGTHRGRQRHARRAASSTGTGPRSSGASDSPMATYLATVTTGRFRVTQLGCRTGSRRTWPWIPQAPARRPVAVEDPGDPRPVRPRPSAPIRSRPTGAIVDHTSIGGLRAGDPDQAPLRLRPRTTVIARPRAGPSVVRRRRDAEALAPDLAERGLRDLVVVVLGRSTTAGGASRQRFDAAVRDPGQVDRVLEPAAGQPRAARRTCSTARSTTRGAMTLEALREKIGSATFFQILRDWVAQHRYGNASTQELHRSSPRPTRASTSTTSSTSGCSGRGSRSRAAGERRIELPVHKIASGRR